ncbi:MAG: D-tyrosyl-tRNA(Tyr) deacylase, partial [Eudoraea sp.]|nr:D-tyrosyl-tRNA(Tyr) deacylase [Eudoraea sp.]
MRAVIQRVSAASVVVNDQTISKIAFGLMVLLGIEESDSMDDI